MKKAMRFFIILCDFLLFIDGVYAGGCIGKVKIIDSEFNQRTSSYYLAILPDRENGIDFIEHIVDRDDDCGFHVLGITRDQLADDLSLFRENKAAREFLAPEVRQAFLSNEIREVFQLSSWNLLHHEYQRIWKELEEMMTIVKSEIEESYPEFLGLNGRIPWLLEKSNNSHGKDRLAFLFDEYNQINSSVDKLCQESTTFEYYINLYRSPNKIWLGYKTALLWARTKDINLHIWGQSPRQEAVLELIDAQIFPNARKTIHMLHTSGFTHFNLLKEVGNRNLIAEREQIEKWNKTDTKYPGKLTLFELFSKQKNQTPGELAVLSNDKSLTYQDIYLRANCIGHALLENGATSNQLVGVLMTKGWEQVVGCLGILASGAAFLPIDPQWPESRISKILRSGEVRLVLSQRHILEPLSGSEFLSGYKCFAIDNDGLWASYSDSPLPTLQSSEDIAYVIFTSGSTGEPKGVVINHNGVVNTILDINQRLRITPKDRVLALSNLTFDLNIYDIFGTLATGGTIVFPDADRVKEPSHWITTIIDKGVTIWNTVPMFMQMLVEYLDYALGIPDLRETLRLILLSGDWIPLDLPNHVRRYFTNGEIISLGGATEGSIWSILYPITEIQPTWKSIPYGLPMTNQTMYVLDHNLEHCPMGIQGDIYIGGVGVALGYWRDKEKTAASFITHPITGEYLYKTGDLGRWNAEGYMEFVGRKDTQVKIDGYRVELGDIEAALSHHPSVKQSVVSTYQKGPHKKLVAYVVPCRSFIETLATKEDLTEDWGKVYEGVYQESISSEDLTFNIAGWNSSYTGEPIPAEEMQEWIIHTIERILSLKPMSVLEIGCGTGLLVSRIASFSKTYVATDISRTALELIERMKSSLEELKHVITLQKPADDFNGLDSFSFDTIVINSVTQCFPSVNYLVRVIKGAASLLKGGGHLFIGDMRNLALLKSHHASIQLHQASNQLIQEEFAQHVQSHLEQEEELLIDPLFFHALRNKVPQIQHVQVHLKRGWYPNELNRFRFDAVLEIGEKAVPTVVPTYRPWSLEKDSLFTLHEQLLEWKIKCSKETTESLGFKGIQNARLQTEALSLDWLNGELDIKTVGELRMYKTDSRAIDPTALYQLGEKLGLRVETTGNSEKPTSLFDVVFIHIPEDTKGPIFTAFSENCSDEVERYTNCPMLSRARRALTSILKEHCQTKLPSYMVPTYFTLLERLPLSSNGKVDRKALPIPLIQQQSEVDQVALITPTEKVMKDMWAEVLGVEGIGMNDNFFSLGGSSLLAVRLVMKANQHFESNYPVSTLFTHTTLQEFANLFQSKKKLMSYRPLLPFHQEGKRPPLFLVHSGRGGAEAYVTLASHFDKDQPLYVLESYNLCNKPPFLTTIEDMAEKYLSYVREAQPKGPYYLGGWSQGGLIAYEMAQTLTKQKEEVRALYFLDTFLFTKFENSQFRSPSRIDSFVNNDPFYTKLPLPYRDHVKNVDRVQTLAMVNYRPVPYTGDVILLKASDHWTFLDTPEFNWDWITRKFMHHVFSKKQNGWGKYISKLKIYPVPGHHQSIMEADNARIIAHIIQEDVVERQKTEKQRVFNE